MPRVLIVRLYSSVFESPDSSVKETTTAIEKDGIDSSPTFASFHAVALTKIDVEYDEILRVTEEMVNLIFLSSSI